MRRGVVQHHRLLAIQRITKRLCKAVCKAVLGVQDAKVCGAAPQAFGDTEEMGKRPCKRCWGLKMQITPFLKTEVVLTLPELSIQHKRKRLTQWLQQIV